MKTIVITFLLPTLSFLLCHVATPVGAQESSEDESKLPVYEMYRTAYPITVDGKLDEPAWFAAPRFDPLQFTWYQHGAKEQTVVKMLWDDENVYLAHICQDAHITARHKNHGDPIPEDDCFEIMIAPNPERPSFYFNIEWNVLGGYIDGHRPAGATQPSQPWDAEGVQIAGSYVGTLNDDTDQDEYWIVEVAIPLKNFARYMPHLPPKPGYQWRINLNRHGGDTNMQYSQWSTGDTPEPAFHTPHRFGFLIFSSKTSPFDSPIEEK